MSPKDTPDLPKMTFEQFEKASRRRLRELGKDRFERAADEANPRFLSEAQFYMAEIERRHGGRVATRDLILELIVILLIGGEIWLGVKAGRDEDAMMTKQTGAIEKVAQSADLSAQSQKATAATLTALQDTTEKMNQALQAQLALFYDLSVLVTWDQTKKAVNVVNSGRTNVWFWGLNIAGHEERFQDPKVLTPNALYEIGSPIVKSTMDSFKKGADLSLPFVAYVKNERKEEFVVRANLEIFWDGDHRRMPGTPLKVATPA
jgi:hypothetical protein